MVFMFHLIQCLPLMSLSSPIRSFPCSFPFALSLALSLSQTSLADKHDKLSGVAAEARGAGQAALKGAGGLHTVLSVYIVEYYC